MGVGRKSPVGAKVRSVPVHASIVIAGDRRELIDDPLSAEHLGIRDMPSLTPRRSHRIASTNQGVVVEHQKLGLLFGPEFPGRTERTIRWQAEVDLSAAD